MGPGQKIGWSRGLVVALLTAVAATGGPVLGRSPKAGATGGGPSSIATVAGGTGGGPPAVVGVAPMELAVAGSKVYVSDTAKNVVRLFDFGSNTTTTVAGTKGIGYFSGDNGPATGAGLNSPEGVAVDGAGNVFIADSLNNRVRRVDSVTGVIATVAGTGASGSTGDGGPATAAKIDRPWGLAVDGADNLFVAQPYQNVVRRVDATSGTITTVAGTRVAGETGDNGPATSSRLTFPQGLAADSAGDLFIAGDFRVRRVDASSGLIATVAGSGTNNRIEENVPAATTYVAATDVALDSTGSMVIADHLDCLVRRVDAATGLIATIAGRPTALGLAECGFSGDGGPANQALLKFPEGVGVDASDAVYIADNANAAMRRVDPSGTITTIGGVGRAGSDSGDGSAAVLSELNQPKAIAFGSGPASAIYVADTMNNRVRTVQPGTGVIAAAVGTGMVGFSGDDGPATSAKLSQPGGVAVDEHGNLAISDTLNNRVRRVDAVTGTITTIAGTKAHGFAGDNGPAALAKLSAPAGLAYDVNGNLLIVDAKNQRVRAIDPSGTITTIAGNGIAGFSGDNGPATSAQIKNPTAVWTDGANNIYLADSGNQRVRRINGGTGVITTLAGSGKKGFSGDGGLAKNAKLCAPTGGVIDRLGNLYFTDQCNNRIRKVDATTLTISTVAGTGVAAFRDNSTSALGGTFALPGGMAIDPRTGLLLVADTGNDRVRTVMPEGFLSATTTSLSSDTNPSYLGQGVTFTATVSAAVGSPTGTATFADGSTTLAVVGLSATTAVFATSDLALGTHSITATYSGDSADSGSVGSVSQVVGPLASSTSISSDINPASYGHTVTFRSVVTGAGGAPVPTGSVTFLSGNSPIGTVVIDDTGSAQITTSSLDVGTNSISASYGGDNVYNGSASSTLDESIDQASTSTSVSAAGDHVAGDAVVLTATVNGAVGAPLGTPTGSVTFLVDGSAIGIGALDGNGTATFTDSGSDFNLGGRSYILTAAYSGDANFTGSGGTATYDTE